MEAKAGLEGIVVGQTAICSVDETHQGLTYRGYDIHELVLHSSFEETAYLLLYGEVPQPEQLNLFLLGMQQGQALPSLLIEILEKLPINCHPMDILRTATSVLGNLEPEQGNCGPAQVAPRLMTGLCSAISYWHAFHHRQERINTVTHEKSLAAHFLKLQNKTFSVAFEKALTTTFLLYAEHEFNASTFAARVCTSTESDYYSAITAAIGTLRGPLHGGANEAAIELILALSSVEDLSQGLQQKLINKEKIMGFGHRVYKKGDPRSHLIKPIAKSLAQNPEQQHLFQVAEQIEQQMRLEKGLLPNLDFYSALVYHFLGIAQNFFTPLFVFSRLSGWSAHVLEQRANNRLIRPQSEYIGPQLRSYLTNR